MNIYKSFARVVGAASLCVTAALAPACTDDIKFGDAFIEKAPDGTLTIDSIYTDIEYVEQALTGIYSTQYYGLPCNNNSYIPWSLNLYRGKLDALTDLYNLNWDATTVYNGYYQTTLSANANGLIAFTEDKVYVAVRRILTFLQNIDQCEELDDYLKARYCAEVKCVLASRYFDLFTVFGGVPIVEELYQGDEETFNQPRRTLDETVEYMVNLLDEAIAVLPWAYDGTHTYNGVEYDETEANNKARWSKAGAMALKAKILTFAASPLYNNDTPYYDGSSQAEQGHYVWYGNFDQARWERALQACRDFFNALDANGFYHLEQASGTTSADYRVAYRNGYLYQKSKEVLHTTRIRDYDNWANGFYAWSNWVHIGRNSYLPTYEYMCMFPWNDGTAFDWKRDSTKIFGTVRKGKLRGQKLFYQYTDAVSKVASRDPRLYENMICNGLDASLGWTAGATTGVPSGNEYELWVGGYHAGDCALKETRTTCYATGFGVMKYDLGPEGAEYQRFPLQWVTLSLNEMYLMYAECLAQTGNLALAADQVKVIRDRVGLKKLISEDLSGLNVLTNKDDMIEAILRERACELGMSNNRYYDMIRYKRTDWMTKQLHGLLTYRIELDADPDSPTYEEYVHKNTPYIGDEKNAGNTHPVVFTYEVFPIKGVQRNLWAYEENPNDLAVRKWFLEPFPATEINKGYGLIQNPGW